ncbi:MAG: O-antigen ligase family protein [Anaerolineae bacterium]|nr:O-antigen ligase family protein [Anaerolineae bacterium]
MRPPNHPLAPLAALVLVTLALLPFEWQAPLLTGPGFIITNLEALILLSVGGWCLSLVRSPRSLRPPAWPVLAVVAVTLLSAVAAPVLKVAALKVAARWLLGALFGLAVAHVTRRPAVVKWAMLAVVLGAGGAAVLGGLELLGVTPAASLLAGFRAAPARLGPLARLNATFGSANTAAMLFEAALCLTLGLTVAAARDGRPGQRWALVALQGLLAVALLLTYSRGGLLGALAGLTVIARLTLMRSPRQGWRWLAPSLASMTLLVALLGLGTPALQARLSVLDERPFDSAIIDAPAALPLVAGAEQSVRLQVTNTGRLVWQALGPGATAVGYHWLSEDGATVYVWGNSPVRLPKDVAPGEAVLVDLVVSAPLAGRYRLAWDVVHGDSDWIGGRAPMPALTDVVVAGAGGEPLGGSSGARTPAPAPDRRALWGAAIAMFKTRPLLGVGPGNFRHLYGGYLGVSQWDDRIQANSLYLELLADGGVAGLLAWLWLIGATLGRLWRWQARPAVATWPYAVALLGALAAWLTHGLVDVALETTAIYGLLWTLIGLALGLTTPDHTPPQGK